MTDQRTSDRGKPSKKIVNVIGIEKDPIPGFAIDESEGGLGIAIPRRLSAGELPLGTELIVHLGEVPRVAVVRHLQPLTWGCQLGVEWKFHELARRTRELLAAAPRKHHELARILPKAIGALWMYLETRQWGQLVARAGQLRDERVARDLPLFQQCVETFQQRVRQIVSEGGRVDLIASSVELAVHDLVQACVAAAIESAGGVQHEALPSTGPQSNQDPSGDR